MDGSKSLTKWIHGRGPCDIAADCALAAVRRTEVASCSPLCFFFLIIGYYILLSKLYKLMIMIINYDYYFVQHSSI